MKDWFYDYAPILIVITLAVVITFAVIAGPEERVFTECQERAHREWLLSCAKYSSLDECTSRADTLFCTEAAK